VSTQKKHRLVVAIAMSTAMVASCDGYIGVEGRVYTSPDVGNDRGVVIMDALHTILPARLTPVAGAEMIVEPWRPEERSRLTRPDLWTERTITDEGGYFKTGTTAAPGKYDATITVRRAGFREVQVVFRHDRLRHQAIVVLAKESVR
jgi:hypothetical protein